MDINEETVTPETPVTPVESTPVEATPPVETVTPPVAPVVPTEIETMRAQLDAATLARQEAITARDTAIAEARQERVTSIATRLGFADPADAKAFLASDAPDIEAALQGILTSKPYLGKSPVVTPPVVTPTSPTNPARSATSQPTFTKAQVADRAFWTANKDQIMVAMREGRIK